MGILAKLIWLFLNLLCIGVDIATFFVLARLVSMWRKLMWLEKLNDIGKSLVDAFAVYAGKLWYKATQKSLLIKEQLFLTLIILLLVRITLCKIGNLFLNPEHTNMNITVIHKSDENSQSSDAIRIHLWLLGHKNYGVTELRIFDPVPMVAYVDNEDDAVRMCLSMTGKTSGIYVGVQPRPAHLFDFAPNRWVIAQSKPHSNCATDNDIEYITACFWDIDVVSEERSNGHPASDEELKQTLHAAQMLSREDGLPFNSVICCSGNGNYVLAPIVPLPVDSLEVAKKFKQFCQQTAQKVVPQSKGVKIDPVYNLSRVMRLMGTVNGKGHAVESRPHRRAYFVTEPMPEMRSMALRYMILNTEVEVIHSTADTLPAAIRCDLTKLADCEFIQFCRKYPELVTEPLWFGLIANLAFLEGGVELVHKISQLDKSRYDHSDTERVVQRILDKGYKPITCKNLIDIASTCPGSSKFDCTKLKKCPARSPMYLATLYTIYKR